MNPIPNLLIFKLSPFKFFGRLNLCCSIMHHLSHIVFSLGPSLDKIKGVGRGVRENLKEDMIYKWDPSWTEKNIKKLESEVESYILNMLKNCIENPQEIEKRISWP